MFLAVLEIHVIQRVNSRVVNVRSVNYIDNRLHQQEINGTKLGTKHFANCNTSSVVYLLVSQCKAFYVGKTKKEWKCMIAEHITDIRHGAPNSPIARHVAHHKKDPSSVRFMALDRIHPDVRGRGLGQVNPMGGVQVDL